MGISIKHDEYERLIRQLATERGVSLTEAVGMAVRHELANGASEPKRNYLEQVRELRAHLGTLPVLDHRAPDEIIGYDEHGLPT